MDLKWLYVILIGLSHQIGSIHLLDESKCSPEEVYIAAKLGCYRKVGLDRECELNEQCRAQDVHSHCGFSTETQDLSRRYHVCLCDVGYQFFSTVMPECLPIQPCNDSIGFNDKQKQNDCGRNQFCRNGVCLCKPKFVLDRAGNCIDPNNLETECTVEYVLVEEPVKGCYEKVSIYDECEYTPQCTSGAAYTVCEWHDSNNSSKTCQCIEGFTANADQLSCIPIKECQLDDWNESHEQADCDTNQFCQNRVCFCKPEWKFDDSGQCVPKQPQQPINPDLDINLNKTKTITDQIQPQEEHLNYVIIIIAIVAFLSSLAIGVFIWHCQISNSKIDNKSLEKYIEMENIKNHTQNNNSNYNENITNSNNNLPEENDKLLSNNGNTNINDNDNIYPNLQLFKDIAPNERDSRLRHSPETKLI